MRHVTVDCLVLRNEEILLAKRNEKLLESGKWSLIGGFVGRDETLEESAKREIMEETGYKMDKLRLLKVNDSPNRPAEDRQNISFVYTCQALEKIGKADWESDEQKWFNLNNLPSKQEIAFDHFDNIQFYLDQVAGKGYGV